MSLSPSPPPPCGMQLPGVVEVVDDIEVVDDVVELVDVGVVDDEVELVWAVELVGVGPGLSSQNVTLRLVPPVRSVRPSGRNEMALARAPFRAGSVLISRSVCRSTSAIVPSV